MATSATTASFLCQVEGGDSGSKVTSVSWTLSAPLLQTDTTELTQGGDTTITVPTGAKLCVLVPPTDNTLSLTLKGNTGDTGVGIDPNEPTVLAPTDSSFIITTGAGTNFDLQVNWL